MAENVIKLFSSTATTFETNGLGVVSDASSCSVTEERNGSFELEMKYPVTGKRYSDISLRNIIVSKSNPYSTPQAFRIYDISKPINGIITVNAEHISYDLTGYPVSAFSAESIQEVFDCLQSKSVETCPFTFTTEKTNTAIFSNDKPCSIRSLLGGNDGSILDVFGGEYEFDNFKVILHNRRGTNGGVSIRYGKNLTDFTQEENCSEVYTAVYPYWYDDTDGLVELSDKTVQASGTYNFTRVYVYDCSDLFSEKPTESELKQAAEDYISANGIGVPTVSIEVSFVQLSQTSDYKDYALLETVYLGDTVSVEFPEFNVSTTARCVKTEYDAITDKYISLELGESKSSLADTISSQGQAILETPSSSFLQRAIDTATKLITGGLGGYVILRDSSGGDQPDEILVMDTPDINTAVNVWRWNKNGLGHSSTGYNGPYSLAMTMDGSIVASMITSGTMSASRINGGILVLGGLDNENGICVIRDGDGNTLVRFDSRGMNFYDTNGNLLGYYGLTDLYDGFTSDTVLGDIMSIRVEEGCLGWGVTSLVNSDDERAQRRIWYDKESDTFEVRCKFKDLNALGITEVNRISDTQYAITCTGINDSDLVVTNVWNVTKDDSGNDVWTNSVNNWSFTVKGF